MHCVVRQKSIDVSEKRAASIFRVKQLAKQETSKKRAAECLLLVNFLLG
jgi:hypothetical protein